MATQNQIQFLDFTDSDIKRMYKKQQRKFIENLMYEKIKDDFESDSFQGTEATMNLIADMREKKVKKTSTHVFITINPPYTGDECKPGYLLKKVNKFLKQKWIKAYAFCIEQRWDLSTDNLEEYKNTYHGEHAHILIRKDDYQPSRIVNQTRVSFASLNLTHDAINFKWQKGKGAKNFLSYIMKENPKNEQQINKCECDKKWRIIHEIEPLYMEGDLFPEKSVELNLTSDL